MAVFPFFFWRQTKSPALPPGPGAAAARYPAGPRVTVPGCIGPSKAYTTSTGTSVLIKQSNTHTHTHTRPGPGLARVTVFSLSVLSLRLHQRRA